MHGRVLGKIYALFKHDLGWRSRRIERTHVKLVRSFSHCTREEGGEGEGEEGERGCDPMMFNRIIEAMKRGSLGQCPRECACGVCRCPEAHATSLRDISYLIDACYPVLLPEAGWRARGEPGASQGATRRCTAQHRRQPQPSEAPSRRNCHIGRPTITSNKYLEDHHPPPLLQIKQQVRGKYSSKFLRSNFAVRFSGAPCTLLLPHQSCRVLLSRLRPLL